MVGNLHIITVFSYNGVLPYSTFLFADVKTEVWDNVLYQEITAQKSPDGSPASNSGLLMCCCSHSSHCLQDPQRPGHGPWTVCFLGDRAVSLTFLVSAKHRCDNLGSINT